MSSVQGPPDQLTGCVACWQRTRLLEAVNESRAEVQRQEEARTREAREAKEHDRRQAQVLADLTDQVGR